MEEIGLADRADFDHALDPLGAGLSSRSLGEGFGDGDTVFGQLEIGLSLVPPINPRDERGLAKKEPEFRRAFELRSQCFVGVNREIRGNKGKLAARLDLGFQEFADGAAMGTVVAQ